MKSMKLSFVGVILVAVLGIQTWAQEQNKHYHHKRHHHKQHHYQLIDMGTLGGAQSTVAGPMPFPLPLTFPSIEKTAKDAICCAVCC